MATGKLLIREGVSVVWKHPSTTSVQTQRLCAYGCVYIYIYVWVCHYMCVQNVLMSVLGILLCVCVLYVSVC